MYAVVKPPENITTAFGNFTCYPVEVRTNIAKFANLGSLLSSLVRPFIPASAFYFDVNPPHYFIHYDGPLGPPGTPEGNLDLVKVVRGEEKIEEIRRLLSSPETSDMKGFPVSVLK